MCTRGRGKPETEGAGGRLSRDFRLRRRMGLYSELDGSMLEGFGHGNGLF